MRFLSYFKNLVGNLYSRKIEDEVVNEVAKEYKMNPHDLRNRIKIKVGFLPFISYIKRIGNKIYRRVGKVLGVYNPLKKEIYIDFWIYLQKLFGNLKPYVKVLAEEVCHAVQDYLGRLKPHRSFDDYLQNYENDENEIEAKEKAERVTNRILQKYRLRNFRIFYF